VLIHASGLVMLRHQFEVPRWSSTAKDAFCSFGLLPSIPNYLPKGLLVLYYVAHLVLFIVSEGRIRVGTVYTASIAVCSDFKT
jgi:hypothetical protein